MGEGDGDSWFLLERSLRERGLLRLGLTLSFSLRDNLSRNVIVKPVVSALAGNYLVFGRPRAIARCLVSSVFGLRVAPNCFARGCT